MKNRKAAIPDEIHGELLKLLEEDGLIVLTKLFNNIYDSGSIPLDWLKSTFIARPKKLNAKKLSDYRTISLMSHVLKVFLRILHERIYRKVEEKIGHTIWL